MKSNDISIDVAAVSGVLSRLSQKARGLDRLAAAMRHNLSVAAKDFTSVNFQRSAEVVEQMQREIENAIENLERLKAFINDITDCAEEYLRCGYNG
ncbi:MAG: hypothetical protein ACI4RO_04965 [Candidatus Scatosoma sp.]